MKSEHIVWDGDGKLSGNIAFVLGQLPVVLKAVH